MEHDISSSVEDIRIELPKSGGGFACQREQNPFQSEARHSATAVFRSGTDPDTRTYRDRRVQTNWVQPAAPVVGTAVGRRINGPGSASLRAATAQTRAMMFGVHVFSSLGR